MRFCLHILIGFNICFAGSIRIESIPIGSYPSEQDYLQYDDGSANWLTWSGTYRGVWFNSEDFLGYPFGPSLNFSEYWMYHHVSYPWDVSSFYAEIWNGGLSGPTELVDQDVIVGLHYSPVFAYHPSWPYVEPEWWPIENTEMSNGGWPSMLVDGSPPSVHHSFYSDDFSQWEPWSSGPNTGDFFVRVECGFIPAFDRMTWGSLKAVF